MSDFNVILGHHEKQGGRRENSRDIGRELQNFLDCSNTRDLGYIGNPYTWSNNRSPPNLILEHLHKCLGNTSWLQNYGDMIIKHLPPIISDHCPFQIADSTIITRRTSFFRFWNMWLLHPGFHEVMQTARERIPPSCQTLSQRLHHLATSFHLWKRTALGSLSIDLKKLQRRITGIHNSSHYESLLYLHYQELELQREFTHKCLQHELFWKQRSRIEWLKEGDKNSKFFHRVVKIQSKRNSIHCLKDDTGTTFNSMDAIFGHYDNFFEDLYNDLVIKHPGPSLLHLSINRVNTDADNQTLMAAPKEAEIRKKTFSVLEQIKHLAWMVLMEHSIRPTGI